MLYKEIPPPPVLSDIVRYFWIIESDDVSDVPLKYRLFAESSPGLVFFYSHHYGLLSGLTDSHREFNINGKLGIIGAYLYPYCLPALFSLPAEQITNTQVEITDLLGSDGASLREQVTNASSNAQRVEIISSYLIRRKKQAVFSDEGILNCVRHIVKYKGAVAIDHVVQGTGISNRQFDRKFQTAVGIPPKVFSRLIRFQSTLQIPRSGKTKNLTTLALDAGYYDQSHFIRDFKEFSGISPKEYFKLDGHLIADNFMRMP